jgi:hypothetical protein
MLPVLLAGFKSASKGSERGEDFDELSRVAPTGSASGEGDGSPYNRWIKF